MAFNELKGNEQKGIIYKEGFPVNLKFNAKAGKFQKRGSRVGPRSKDIQIIKTVDVRLKVGLFPYEGEKENLQYYPYIVIFFVDNSTDKLNVGLIKTYSEGAFTRMLEELEQYNLDNDTNLGIERFNVNMKFTLNPANKKNPDSYYVDFTFAKDKKGKPCHLYVLNDETGMPELNESAIVQKIDDETFERNATFYTQEESEGDHIYSYHIAEEICKWNMQGFNELLPPEQLPFIAMAMHNLGFISAVKYNELTHGSILPPVDFGENNNLEVSNQKQLQAA